MALSIGARRIGPRQYPRSLLTARAGTWKPRQKAGFDFGTCQTRLRSPWHAANPLRGPPGSGVQCEDRYILCLRAHEMRAARARRVAAAYGSACERL